MNAAARNVVIWDFGGVLVDWNPRYLYRKVFGVGAEASAEAAMERFLAEVCTPAWNLQQDAGRPWDEAVRELTAQFPAEAERIRAYHERWEETLRGPIEDSVAILGELEARGHRQYGLTNWSHEKFPLARARYRFFDWFDGIVVSGDEKLIKPDPRLYVCLLERYHIAPAAAVFIDDSRANVDAAIALGIHGIHFRSPAQLRGELVDLGLVG
jgi:2-haloacid dehalogenase